MTTTAAHSPTNLEWMADGDERWHLRTWSPPLADPDYRASVARRLSAGVAPGGNECHLWQRHIGAKGYGVISIKKRMTGVHQVALALALGRMWPLALQVDHLCRTRHCCNPNHLELVTGAENTDRGLAPWLAALRQVRKTHCPQGHPYSEANTYWSPRTGRMCRRCRADGARRAARNMAEAC